jgi:AraC-like DNA-binding protein
MMTLKNGSSGVDPQKGTVCLSFSLFALIFISVAQISLADLSLPVHDSLWGTFDDSKENGSSINQKLTVTNDSIEWIFKLGTGAHWPYMGLYAIVQTSYTAKWLWQTFNEKDSLVIVLSSNREGPLSVQLSSFDPIITKKEDPVSFRTLETTITVTKKIRRVALPLQQFRIADWWKSRYKISPEDNNLCLNSICLVNWVFTDSSRFNQNDTLRIYSLRLKHHTNVILSGLTLIFAATMILILLRVFKRKKISKSIVTTGVDPFQPIPVTVAPSEWESVKLYLERNYLDPGMNLKKAADALCFSESKISRLVRENHKDGFRSLIHELRIKEAKQLLRETDTNVAEIAYKLGYATPSHFNREFKCWEGVTPTAFRRNSNIDPL